VKLTRDIQFSRDARSPRRATTARGRRTVRQGRSTSRSCITPDGALLVPSEATGPSLSAAVESLRVDPALSLLGRDRPPKSKPDHPRRLELGERRVRRRLTSERPVDRRVATLSRRRACWPKTGGDHDLRRRAGGGVTTAPTGGIVTVVDASILRSTWQRPAADGTPSSSGRRQFPTRAHRQAPTGHGRHHQLRRLLLEQSAACGHKAR